MSPVSAAGSVEPVAGGIVGRAVCEPGVMPRTARTRRVVASVAVVAVVAAVAGACGDTGEESGGERPFSEVPAVPPGAMSVAFLPDPAVLDAELVGLQRDLVRDGPVIYLGDPPLVLLGDPGDPTGGPTYVASTVDTTGEPLSSGGEAPDAAAVLADRAHEVTPVVVDGIDGLAGTDFSPHDAAPEVAWPAGPDTIAVVAAVSDPTTESAELVAVAERLELIDGRPTVVAPNDSFAELATLDAAHVDNPHAVQFQLARPQDSDRPGTGATIAVIPVTPEEQLAYRLLIRADPAAELATAGSCCPDQVARPPREIEIDFTTPDGVPPSTLGRRALAGAIGTFTTVVVVEGDPGVVVRSTLRNLGPLSTDELVAFAASLRPVTVAEVDERSAHGGGGS